jgi:hypothetical protein
MADVSADLVGLGVDGTRVRTEIFGAALPITPGITPAAARPPHPPAGEPGDGPRVAFARSGLTVRWDDGYASLLELAEAATCRYAGHAAPACATRVRQPCCPGRSATPPTRSMTPPTATRCSAAPSRTAILHWTCDPGISRTRIGLSIAARLADHRPRPPHPDGPGYALWRWLAPRNYHF